MNIKELIEHLQTFPQDMEVAYEKYSEQCILTKEDVGIALRCHAREDGWIENFRKDKPSKEYLLFPGN